MSLRGRFKDNGRKVTPPGPAYMSNDQFASYLKDLRSYRPPSKPGGARPLPSSGSVRSRASAAREFFQQADEQQRSSSVASVRKSIDSFPASSVSSRHGRQLVKSPSTVSSAAPRSPLKPSDVVPTATYIERGHRWMEKEEAVSLRNALDDMKTMKEEEDEARIFAAAQQEASELVHEHQHPKPARPPLSYKNHLRKNSYAEARAASIGPIPVEMETGLARDIPRSVSSGSNDSGLSYRSRVSSSCSMRSGAASPDLDGRISPEQIDTAIKERPLKAYPRHPPLGRRRSSGRRNISGEIGKTFTTDQIWEEPGETEEAEAQTTPKPIEETAIPLRSKPRNPLNRVQFEAPESQENAQAPNVKLHKIEIYKNPPTQSRNAEYTKSTTIPIMKSNDEEVKMRDGKEIRSEELRKATSMFLKDRSPLLPMPTAISMKPGRPIVSFDANWKPKEADESPEEPTEQRPGSGPKPDGIPEPEEPVPPQQTAPVVDTKKQLPPVTTVSPAKSTTHRLRWLRPKQPVPSKETTVNDVHAAQSEVSSKDISQKEESDSVDSHPDSVPEETALVEAAPSSALDEITSTESREDAEASSVEGSNLVEKSANQSDPAVKPPNPSLPLTAEEIPSAKAVEPAIATRTTSKIATRIFGPRAPTGFTLRAASPSKPTITAPESVPAILRINTPKATTSTTTASLFNAKHTVSEAPVPTVSPSIPTINLRGSSPSIPTISLPGAPPSVPMINLPETAPSIPKINLPDSTPSVPVINLPDSVPSVPTINVSDAPSISISEPGSVPEINVSEASAGGSSVSQRPLPDPKSFAGRRQGGPSPAQRSHWSRAVGSRATVKCHQCEIPIEGKIVSVHGVEGRFHPECLSCYTCGMPLEAMEISPEPDSFRAARLERINRRQKGEILEEIEGQTAVEDGDSRMRFFCHLDWHERFAPRCKHCKTPIIGEHIVALGEHWHKGHFFCAECGDPFDGKTTHIEKDGYAWCLNCQTKRTERRAPKCKGCKQPVIGVYTIAMGGEWHEHCFCCVQCGGGFADGQIFPKQVDGVSLPVCLRCMEMEWKS